MIYDVDIEMLEHFCVFDLKGAPEEIAILVASLHLTPPGNPCTATRSEEMLLCWIGPAQWILRAPQSMAPQLTQELQANGSNDTTSSVEISDMLQFFSARGSDADEILAVCCPLDTHQTAFPSNAATFTELLGTKALLLREIDGFQFAVDRSYADFINDNLHRVLGTPLPVDHAGRAPHEPN